MSFRLHPLAKEQLVSIWKYTETQWGEVQADRYIDGLFGLFAQLHSQRYLWRAVRHHHFKGVFMCLYQKHVVLFKELSPTHLGILGIVHQSSHLPRQLRLLNETFNLE